MNAPGTLNLFGEKTNFTVHKKEAPAESQKILDANKNHFQASCRRVFDALMTGKPYTTRELDAELNMSDSRKRISDLIKINRVHIQEPILIRDRYKVWQMNAEDIMYNEIFR